MKRVDIVNILLPLIYFSLDPVSVEVAEQMVDITGGGGVPIPLLDIERKQGFFFVNLALLENPF